MSAKLRFPVHIRGIAIVMLFAMFHYIAGYRLLYSMGILFAKEEAKESIMEKNKDARQQNFVSLLLSANEYKSLKWNENHQEFSYNNEMYDVVGIQKSGDDYILTVYSDDNETGWVSAYHNFEKEFFHTDGNQGSSNKSAEDIMSSFQKDFTPQTILSIDHSSSFATLKGSDAFQLHPLQSPANIWHPPVNC